MVQFLKRQSGHSLRFFDFYVVSSLLAGLSLWSYLYLTIDNFVLDSFFLTSFLVGNLYFAQNGLGHGQLIRESKYYPGIFLFQFLCLSGAAFYHNSVGLLYINMIPCLAGIYFLELFNESRIEKRWGPLFIVGLSYYFFYEATGNRVLAKGQEIFPIVFMLWGGGLFYLGSEALTRKQKGLIKSLMKNWTRQKETESIMTGEENPKERFFFHDLINHTHGVNLFLGHRIHSKESLGIEDCENLLKEVKLIQSLIKDHFGYGHKNLLGTYENVHFEVAKEGLVNLVQTYLPDHLVQTHFTFIGKIGEKAAAEEKMSCMVHYPVFYRIFNNLIKNVSEQNSDEVELLFDYQEEGLFCTVKNKILHLKDQSNLAENLSKIILESYPKEFYEDGGVGLESIGALCESKGGHFHFALEGDFWVNKLFLPNPNLSVQEEAA
ncbi:MAG: GHKL domain-containing protein [Halobacteriovoraceae bacterium]|jgi:hypothetical protein|nr:GHKL domain-containing protein [Halobacteriovoraceae bacterium]